jgi:hypothetical protein
MEESFSLFFNAYTSQTSSFLVPNTSAICFEHLSFVVFPQNMASVFNPIEMAFQLTRKFPAIYGARKALSFAILT